MLKISFSGISLCGKTSLFNEVKKILSLKDKVGSVDEINGKNPFDNNSKSSFSSQFFYFTTQINEENIQAAKTLDYLCCDRSIFDQWVYWKKNLSIDEHSPDLKHQHEIMKNLYQFWIKTYDLLFFIRINFEDIKNREIKNEFRTADIEYFKRAEEEYLETIQEDNLEVIEIWNNNSIDEAAHKIIKAISEYKEAQKPPEIS